MATPSCEVSVREKATKHRVAVEVVAHGKVMRWWAVTENACDAMAARRPLLDRRGDAATFEAGWLAIAKVLDGAFPS